jgi:opacity protein-like surface antigen
MRRLLLPLVPCLALAGPLAQAADGEPPGRLYLFADLAWRSIDVDGSDFDAFTLDRLDTLGLSAMASPGSLNEDDPSWQIAAGWRLTERFALEFGYTDYGSVGYDTTLTASGSVDDVTFDGAAGSVDATVDAAGVSFSVVGRQPVTRDLDVYARLGIVHTLIDNRGSARFQQGSGESAQSLARDIGNSGSDQSLAWGVGAAWRLDDGPELRLDYGGVGQLGGSGPVDDAGLQRLAAGIVYSL